MNAEQHAATSQAFVPQDLQHQHLSPDPGSFGCPKPGCATEAAGEKAASFQQSYLSITPAVHVVKALLCCWTFKPRSPACSPFLCFTSLLTIIEGRVFLIPADLAIKSASNWAPTEPAKEMPSKTQPDAHWQATEPLKLALKKPGNRKQKTPSPTLQHELGSLQLAHTHGGGTTRMIQLSSKQV